MGPQLVASFVYTSDSSSVLSAAHTAFFRFGQSAECVTLSEMENTIVKMSLFLRSWKGGRQRAGVITFTDISLSLRPYKRPTVSNEKNCRCTFPSGVLPLASHSPHTY